MTLSRNLLAGFTSSVWTAFVSIAVVPLYLKYLGIEAYGLIGFFATIQILLSLLDFGLTTTINREVARYSSIGKLCAIGSLLHTLVILYLSIALIIGFVIVLAAPSIAKYWLESHHISIVTVTHAVMLMGLVVACRWPLGLYQGVLIGAQRLTVSSSINIIMATVGGAGSVITLAWVSPTIEAFFVWQACTGMLHVLMMRWAAWRLIGHREVHFELYEIKRIWRFSAGMGGVAIFGLILTQTDKVLLSKMLSLEDFGRYSLAWVIVSGLFVLISPTFNAIYPRFSSLVGKGSMREACDLYQIGIRILSSVIFPLAISIAIFSEDLVLIWTSNKELAKNIAPIIALLSIGTALNGVMYFPYALQLAHGMVKLPFFTSGGLVLMFIPLVVILTMWKGAIGGASAWLLVNLIYVFIGTLITHRSLHMEKWPTWLFQSVGIPFLMSTLVVLGGRAVVSVCWGWKVGYYLNLVWICSLVILGITISLLMIGWFRDWVMIHYHDPV